MKTTENFRKKKVFKRYNTITAGSPEHKNKQTSIQSYRERIKTTICKNDDEDEQLGKFITKDQKLRDLKIDTNLIFKTEEDDDYNLTSDFVADWSRITSIKKETYSKLRNQMVKKYPSYLQKYKDEDLNEQSKALKTQQSKQKPFSRTTYSSTDNRQSRIRKTNKSQNQFVNPNQTNCFYSRSKKKCFTNTYKQQQIPLDEKIVAVPRLSFISYIQKPENRNCLKRNKLRGVNMIIKKDDILGLEKQGSKPYERLKRYLQDAIDTCKKK